MSGRDGRSSWAAGPPQWRSALAFPVVAKLRERSCPHRSLPVGLVAVRDLMSPVTRHGEGYDSPWVTNSGPEACNQFSNQARDGSAHEQNQSRPADRLAVDTYALRPQQASHAGLLP